MIDGRENKSKECDFMKVKKILVSMFLLFLVLCLKSNVSTAAEVSTMERLDYWDITKEYTVAEQDVTCLLYTSPSPRDCS